jgi:hypothetical protein
VILIYLAEKYRENIQIAARIEAGSLAILAIF